MEIVRHLTRDGGLIQHGVEFYLLCRMANPSEKVRVVDWEPKGSSLIDGQPLIRYIVERPDGERMVVEPWQLSRVPAAEMYRQLRAQRSPFRVPVQPVKLAG